MKTLQSQKGSWSERSIFSLIILIVAAQGAAAQTNTFPTSGNAGVGTTSPTQLLQINTSTSGGGVLLSNTASSAGTFTPIQFKFDVGPTAEIRAIKPNAGTGSGTPINTDLSFRVWDSAVAGHWSNALYIKSNGNVGIGTTNPQWGRLQVNKVIRIDDDSGSPTGSDVLLGAPMLYLGTTTAGNAFQFNGGGGLDLWQHNGSWARTVTFAKTGNVGIGTTTPGSKLDVVGNINTSKQYNIGGNRVFSIAGWNNTFAGNGAGNSNTTGANNSFFGNNAGNSNTTGSSNVFFGDSAGLNNTTGGSNVFIGGLAGRSSTGSGNTFVGTLAGQYTTGSENSFFGLRAGFLNSTGQGNSFFGVGAGTRNAHGSNNIVIGNNAGGNLRAGSNNIYLANAGGVEEGNSIRIGTQGTQTETFIAGIRGAVVAGDAVFVDANGRLGVGPPSSRRFKQDIGAMGNASGKLMQLRPVVFHYRPEYVTGKPTLQYGLIAEEVATVYPELVGFSADGKPQTVRYHLLNTLLLNEVQKQKGQIQSQEQELKSQARQIADLEVRLRRLEPQALTRRRRR